jgi:hypothetical protein
MDMLMSSDDSFRDLMEHVKCGSDRAVERLLEFFRIQRFHVHICDGISNSNYRAVSRGCRAMHFSLSQSPNAICHASCLRYTYDCVNRVGNGTQSGRGFCSRMGFLQSSKNSSGRVRAADAGRRPSESVGSSNGQVIS